MKQTWVKFPNLERYVCTAFMCPFWLGPGICSERFVSLHYDGKFKTIMSLWLDENGIIKTVSEDRDFYCSNSSCDKCDNGKCKIKKVRLTCEATRCKFRTSINSCCFMDVDLDSSGKCLNSLW